MRYDTGNILNDSTKAWISVSKQEASDWIGGSAENRRDHIATKFISTFEKFQYHWLCIL
jgi:iron complex outermembrane recepter protein